MKKQKGIFLLGGVLLLLFALVAFLTFQHSNRMIQQGYLASEGNAAQNFAVLTAANIHLSNAQVEKLKNYTYQDLLVSSENKQLRDMMSGDGFVSKVDYAYVMLHLGMNEVKYFVTEENRNLYDAPIGTPLDIMWLLDVNVGENTDAADMAFDGREEERYSYFIPEDTQIFSGAPTYIFNSSEWGDHICGYAPLYSSEGNYIGVVGVELETTDYDSYLSGAMYSMGLLLGVSTVTLMLLFTVLYRYYRKMQLERIYTDPLTRISNRSYYNDRFVKAINGEHPRSGQFALMIADIDWFKKVNDTFGHEIGDEVLMEVSAILMEEFGKSHVMRFGGEEFVVGLWIQGEAELRDRLEKLYARFRAVKYSRRQIEITLSLGASWCKCHELSGWLVSGMLKQSDTLLYAVKENGRKAYRMEAYTGPTAPEHTTAQAKKA